MALTIDSLEIQIQDNAQNSTKGIDALATSLRNLKSAMGDSNGLISNLAQLSQSLKAMSSASKSFAKGIESLNKSTQSLNSARLAEFSAQMQGIANGLSHLANIGKSNLGSIVNAVKKIPEITKSLDPATIEAFSNAIQRLTQVVTPLGIQMDAIARGFNTLPGSIKKATRATNSVNTANSKAALSFKKLTNSLASTVSKFYTLYNAMRSIINIFAEAFKKSNEYIESLNLFRVSMGEASDAAMEYAETVSKAMGIDIAEWITGQGTFMRMATGFGIASDQAEIMSQNLTQLAYDMASFFNTDVETAMQKLQSGMSGQIKGLKAWGYNLSVAALQETALSLGIEQSVRTMTEAQKAQLRYITLIQKSQGVMGDMAKTINTPANSMRILQAQMERLQRALGNIVSVLITRYIPYIMAFVEVMEEAANALAKAWGFEIPELPENNLDMGADVIEGIGGEAEDALEPIEELKKQLMGFDELNILKSDTSNNGDVSYDLGFEMPEYDFMTGLEALDLEPFKKKLKEILDIAIAIGIAILGWKVSSTLFSNFGTVNKLLETIGVTALTTAGKLQLCAGAGLAISGALLEAKGVIETFKEGLDLSSFLEQVGGGAGLVGGGALIGKAFGKAFLGGGIGAIIAGVPMFISGVYDAIKNGIEWLNATLTALGATSTGAGIGAAIGSAVGPIGIAIGATIGLAVGALTDFGIWLWQKFDAVEEWFKNLPIWAKTLSTIVGYLVTIGAGIAGIGVIIAGAVTGVGAIFLGIGAGLLLLVGAIAGVIVAIKKWDVITSWIKTKVIDPIAGFFSNLWQGIVNIWNTAPEWFNSNVIQPLVNFFTPVVNWIGTLFEGCWLIIRAVWVVVSEWFNSNVVQPIVSCFNKLWADIKAVWSVVSMWFDTNVIQPVVIVWSLATNAIGGYFRKLWADIQTVWSVVSTWFDTTIVQPLVSVWNIATEKISSFFSTLWSGIKAGVASAMNGVIGVIESALNWVIGGINNLVGGFNTVANWAASVLGEEWGGLSLIQDVKFQRISMYELGGFPSMGEFFLARERGPELVGRIGSKNAVANNDQIITGVSRGVYNAMMAAQESNNGGGTPARVIVQIGERVVGEAAVNFINGKIVQTGVSPIYS